MIRLLIEGEAGKAEHTFWKTLLDATLNTYEIYTTHGTGGAEAATRQLSNDSAIGDIAIVALDRYTWATYRRCVSILAYAARQRNFTLYRVSAQSFESIFVSYTRLPSLVMIKSQIMRAVLNEVAGHINAKMNFANKLGGYAVKMRTLGLTADVGTQERFVAWLLNQVTLKPASFHISKSKISQCWLIPCCTAHTNTQHACPSWRNAPQAAKPNKSFWEKMLDLEAQSVLRLSSHSICILQ